MTERKETIQECRKAAQRVADAAKAQRMLEDLEDETLAFQEHLYAKRNASPTRPPSRGAMILTIAQAYDAMPHIAEAWLIAEFAKTAS